MTQQKKAATPGPQPGMTAPNFPNDYGFQQVAS